MGDRRTAALTLGELGTLAREQGQLDQAQQFLEEALNTFRQLEDRREGALTLRERGILAREQAQPEPACEFLEEALMTFQKLKDLREAARTQKELGILAREQGEADQARQFLEEALATFRESGDPRGFARTLLQLGILIWQQGRLEDALYLLLKAGTGLALVEAPDAQKVEEMLGQLCPQLGEEAFLSTVMRVAKEAPEPVYRLNQAAWAIAIRKIAGQALPI